MLRKALSVDECITKTPRRSRRQLKKTEVINYNIPLEHPLLTTTEDTALHSWVNWTEQDLKVRNALAWRALNMPHGTNQIKLSFFYATVKSVLLYGGEYWILKPTLLQPCRWMSTLTTADVLKKDAGVQSTNKLAKCISLLGITSWDEASRFLVWRTRMTGRNDGELFKRVDLLLRN